MLHLSKAAKTKLAKLKKSFGSRTSIPAAALIIGLIFNAVTFVGAEVMSRSVDLSFFRAEKDQPAPIDRGLRPSVNVPRATSKAGLATAAATVPALFGGLGQTPSGGSVRGVFGPVIPWPIIPIHVSLLPDGRVLSYGTNQNGTQSAQLVYDIWDPELGVGLDAHTVLPNTTATDIFCGTGTLIAGGLNGTSTSLTGKFLSLGGDLTVNGVRNFSNNVIEVFDPAADSLTSAGTMQFPRWYASLTTLPNANKLLLGGQLNPGVGVTTPEIFSPTAGWRTLSGISIPDALYNGEWYYPRASVGQNGLVYLLQHNGKILVLDTGTSPTLRDTGVRMAGGSVVYPAVTMPVKPNYPAFRMMMVRDNKAVQIVDLSGSQPVVTNVASPLYDRQWGSLTLLADGNVLATGGSGAANALTNVAYQSEIFWPRQAIWVIGAKAAIPRLYHSTSLLLPDGSVLTGGGGAPGPINNLNAEIYYPNYLYNSDGTPAQRPTIASAPSSLKPGQSFQLTVGPNDMVGSVTLARVGYDTHSYDPEARLIYVDYSQTGTTVTGFVKSDPKIVPPGYYMVFVFNTLGHPSIAQIVSVPQVVQ